MKNKIIFLILILLFILTYPVSALETETVTELNYQVIESYRHDPKAFTQGLEIFDNNLYEGTGLYGKSSLRKLEIKSGRILDKINLSSDYFGEGITILNNKIYQLSWKENIAFVYDLNFNLIKKINYSEEGWGLANDGKHLIMSNGSEYLYFRNPDTFELAKKIKVRTKDRLIKNINELEYQNGFIYANIWQTDYIIKIDAASGKVSAYLDLSGILKTDYTGEINVLNGIAYDSTNKTFLVTGKLWPKIYRIKIID
ncbi:glutaminyl-peptide cyclotransferase [Halanaerobium sp. ST460_2HS_T2]|uniref:glutaminyl-peptide cyclotransferase n=1 Tax=Halanaerobium sp. ST460_2HS_T2 TaxID=2183914 RepID=UPI000DF23A6E|nr:glutaminyl-peptide cyclotransferase [Halanaerobium sp. ST460_2HS_T2]RCW53343.1 glutamine cyclotransferase [Halanaerobium sp. ST460_2HS_T2]